MMLFVVVTLAVAILSVIAIGVASRERSPGECERCRVPNELLFDECEHVGGGWVTGLRVYACPSCGSVREDRYALSPLD